MKKKLLYITILTVIALFQFLVVKQYIADRYYKSVKSEIRNPDLQNNKTGVSDFEIRESILKKAIHWDKNNPEFHYELAKLYERQMHQAAQEEGKWETSDNKPVFIEGERSKHFEQLAIKEYYRAISMNPCVNYYHLDIAWLFKSKLKVGSRRSEVRGQRSEIIKEFRRATALAPNRTYNHKVFADWLVEDILYLEKDNKLPPPPCPPPRRGRVWEEVKKGNSYTIKALFDEAVREYKKAISLRPSLFNEALKSMTRLTFDYNVLKPIAQEDNRRLKDLVFFLYNKKEWEENREKFLADMDLQIDQYDFNNQSPEILYPYYDTLATLLQKEKKAEKVAGILQEYLKIDPDNGKIHLKLAGLALSAGKWETSVHHFKRAIEIDPDNTSGRRQYVSALASHKDSITVETELKSIIRKYHEDAFSYEALGNLLLRQERFDEAEETYRKILSDTPDKARGYALLKNLYEKQGEHEKAEAIYRKIVSVIPDKARGYYLLGNYYEARKDREKARENYRKATLLNRRYRSHFNRMIPPDMLFEEYFKTTHDYDKLKGLIPLSPDSLNKLVLFLYRNNAWKQNRGRFMEDLNRATTDLEKAAGDTQKIKQIRPWLFAYYKTLAEIYNNEGKHQKAISILEKLVETDVDNPKAHLLLAQESSMWGGTCGYDWSFSRNHYEEAIALSPENPDYRKAYAVRLFEAGNLSEAECQMQMAIIKRPNDPGSHEILGNIYEQAGKIDLAIDELSKAVSLSRGAEKYKKKLAQLLALK